MGATARDDAARLIEDALGSGFAAAGVCEARPTDHADALDAWLAAGKQGSMAYLERNDDVRRDPRLLGENIRALLIVADLYSPRGARDPLVSPDSLPVGRIARYARGDDYHDAMKRRLHALCDQARQRHPGHEFRAFVDTAPVLEREMAARAGIGWVAKHTLVISRELGSYILLGGVATSLELDPPESQRAVADHCGSCTRCIDACPTDAITPYSVDASRCVSYLTIERRGPIDPVFFKGIGDWVFGCDICQEVCPHNARPGNAVVPDAYRPRRASIRLDVLLDWTEQARREDCRRSAMKRAKLDMMRRNAVIAAGNAIREGRGEELRPTLERLASDADEPTLVREAARSVLASLSG